MQRQAHAQTARCPQRHRITYVERGPDGQRLRILTGVVRSFDDDRWYGIVVVDTPAGRRVVRTSSVVAVAVLADDIRALNSARHALRAP